MPTALLLFVVFWLGMCLVVYGLRNAGPTDRFAALLNLFAQGGVRGAALAVRLDIG